jgi:hypothetical protein
MKRGSYKNKTSRQQNRHKMVAAIIISLFVTTTVLLLTYGHLSNNVKVKGLQSENYEFPDGYQIASWLWTPPDEIETEELKDLIVFSKDEKINLIYLDVSKYIDILEGSKNKNLDLAKFESGVQRFINEAHRSGIKVHALMGSPNWAKRDIHYVPLKITDFVYGYNSRNQSQKFDGMQFDIEFYGQTDFEENSKQRVIEFLDLVQLLVRKNLINNKDPNFQFGFAMPFWIDQTNSTLPIVEWRGGSRSFMDHFVFTLDLNSNSYIALMSYRNKASGIGGTIDITKNKIDYLEKHTKNISLLVGQETSQNEIPKITFYGLGKQNLKSAIATVQKAFAKHKVLTGFAIHHLYSYWDLTETASNK